LIVLSTGQYGHVAVITGVSGSKVQVIEQNSSPSGQNAYSTSQAACFLTH
jgi:surface antigen